MHQYCEKGICTSFKRVGEQCEHKFQCGRTATCWFNNPNSIYGVCTEYLKFEAGDTTNRVFHQIGTTQFYDDDSKLLCASQYYNSSGYCQTGPKSTNKGKECNSTTECPSDVAGINAACSCGWNSEGKKYCSILEGDDEWVDAKSKVGLASSNCFSLRPTSTQRRKPATRPHAGSSAAFPSSTTSGK